MKSKQAIVTTSLLLAMGLPSAMAQTASGLTAAGTLIRNTATLEYTPPSNPGVTTPVPPLKIISNTVQTRVTPVCAVSVVPNGSVAAPAQTRSVLLGETVVLPYTISNVGNFTHSFSLTAEDVAGGTVAPFGNWTVHEDINNNGVIDANEPAITELNVSADAGQNTRNLLVRGTAHPDQAGDAFVNLIASCGAGTTVHAGANGTDNDNVSKVSVLEPGTPAPEKSFTPPLISAGQNSVVTVKVSNPSDVPTGRLVVEDDLTDQRNRGLSFVPGTLDVSRIGSADAVVEYRDEQGNYTAAEPASGVFGIRVIMPAGLAPRTEGIFTFTMHADALTAESEYDNTVVVDQGGKKKEFTAKLKLDNVPEVWIGPRGNPMAVGEADRQRKPGKEAAMGEICFDHTVLNNGNVADRYRFDVEFTQPAAPLAYKIFDEAGNELVQPLYMRAGESRDLRVCYATNTETVIESTVRVTGERKKPNGDPVTDPTQNAVMLSPTLYKSVAVTPVANVDNNGVHLLEPKNLASELVYTLKFTNTTSRVMKNVIVIDDLPLGLDYITSSVTPTEAIGTANPDGSIQDAKLRWHIGDVAAGQEVAITVTTRVNPERVKLGVDLENRFRITHEDPTSPVDPSNPVVVRTPVGLQVNKTVDNSRAYQIGDRVRFKVTVTNPKNSVIDLPIELFDRPQQDNALEYVPGSSTYKAPGAPEAISYSDPKFVDRVIQLTGKDKFNLGNGFWPDGTTVKNIMYWDLRSEAPLKPGESAEITYEMRLLPGAVEHASSGIKNYVLGDGNGETAVSEAEIRSARQFKPLAEIIGRVFIDRDRNGIFDKNIDTPVERARLALAGGRIALTDGHGRYSFLNVPMGTHAVRLDPSTTPYPPLVKVQEGGLIGTQSAHVTGLTSLDFPLAPLGGEIDVVRRTTVQSGPIALEKSVFKTEGGYAVSLNINVSEAVGNVNITDPLPSGARLLNGTAGYNGALAAGRHNVTYTFAFASEPRQAVTDPQIDWR